MSNLEKTAVTLYNHWRRNSPMVGEWETATPTLQATFLGQAQALVDAEMVDTEEKTAREWAEFFEMWDNAVTPDGVPILTTSSMIEFLKGPQPFGIAKGDS